MHVERWLLSGGMRSQVRWPLLWAFVGLVIYVGAVFGGSILQDLLSLPLQMGWGQQITGALMALTIASVLGDTRGLIGFQPMPSGWWKASMTAGLSIAITGTIASYFLPPDSTPLNAEYFAYEATLPGIGEEFGMRGLWLGLLVIGVSHWQRVKIPTWLLLVFAAVPFAFLHILHFTGMSAMIVFSVTLYAGTILGWARFKTGSIWPAVIAHNIANVCMGLYDLIQHS